MSLLFLFWFCINVMYLMIFKYEHTLFPSSASIFVNPTWRECCSKKKTWNLLEWKKKRRCQQSAVKIMVLVTLAFLFPRKLVKSFIPCTCNSWLVRLCLEVLLLNNGDDFWSLLVVGNLEGVRRKLLPFVSGLKSRIYSAVWKDSNL